jgi:hypothetical protein
MVSYRTPASGDQLWVTSNANKRQMKAQGYTVAKTLFDFSGGSLVS